MSSYRFAVQQTRNAFGPSEEPQGWYEASRHTTLSAARRRMQSHAAEMSQTCGPNAWSHHHRIIALHDTQLRAVAYCECGDHIAITVPWAAGEPMPNIALDDALYARGWPNWSECGTCRRAEDERMYREHEA